MYINEYYVDRVIGLVEKRKKALEIFFGSQGILAYFLSYFEAIIMLIFPSKEENINKSQFG